MELLLHNLEPIHWAVAGAVIAAVTVGLQWYANINLGVSTVYENLCSIVSEARFFSRESLKEGAKWRYPFILGLLLAGVVSSVSGSPSGTWEVSWSLGRFDALISDDPIVKLVWMFVGGLFIGFGTRMSGGCTSGHGIFGLSTFQLPSLWAALSFMGAGVVTTQLIYNFILG